MATSFLVTETTVIAMAKALKPLPDEWLAWAPTRGLAYIAAGIADRDAQQFDEEAARRETLRRQIIDPSTRKEFAA